MAEATTAAEGPPLLCRGIQHQRLPLQLTPDTAGGPDCLKRWSYNNRSGWHSRACLFIVSRSDKKQRCKKCLNEYSNIRPDRFRDLFPDRKKDEEEERPAPVPAEAEKETLSARELVLSDEEAVKRLLLERISAIDRDVLGVDISHDTCPEMAIIAKAMRAKGQSSVVLDGERVFTVCDGEGCESFRVRKQHGLAGTSCKKCIGKRYNDKRYAVRREDHAEMRVAPDSHVNARHLSDSEQMKRLKNIHDQRQWTKVRLERALEKAKKLEKKVAVSETMRKHMHKAMKELANNKEAQDGLWETLYAELKKLEEQGKYTQKEPLTRESCKRFIDEWVMHAKNWVHVERGRPTAVSYNPSFLGPALNQYLRSPASQRQFREDSCLIQPSPSWMQKIKSGQHCSDGFNVECPVIQPTYRGTGTVEHGQIAWDEMHVTRGTVLNVKDDSLRGVTKDFYDMGKIVTNLLDEEEIDEAEEPAIHVNQYCYRSVTGRVYNIMCFFNNGSISANVSMRQLFFVVMSCEMVGSRVFGLICDAGGSFKRLLRYLGKKQKMPEVAWIPLDMVRFRNPYDRSRWIYTSHCSTHNIKNTRGRVWQSIENSGKELLDAEGYFMGKFLWVAAWLRDEERASRNVMRETLLRQAAIELDKWSKMSAKWAKAPFAWKTMIEILQYLYQRLGLTREEMYRVKDHPTQQLGYLSAAARFMRRKLKEKDPGNRNLMCQISSFELGANISELYNQGVLDMSRLISHDKIDLYEQQAKQNLGYFAELRAAGLARRAAGNKNWENRLFHSDTYDIMRWTFRGFFGYCRYLIEYAATTPSQLLPPGMNTQFAVTPAHANTSFVEAWFSLVRLMGLDEATKYVSAVANRLMSQGIKEALKMNPMYEESDVGLIRVDKDLGPLEMSKLHKAKRKVRDALIDMFKSKNQPYKSPAPAFGAAIAVHELTASTDVSELMNSLGTSSETNESDTNNDAPAKAAAVVTENESSSEDSALNSSMESDVDTPAAESSASSPRASSSSGSAAKSDAPVEVAAGAVDLLAEKDSLGSPSKKQPAEDNTSTSARKRTTAQRSPQKPTGLTPAKKTSKSDGGGAGPSDGAAAAAGAAPAPAAVRNPYLKTTSAQPKQKWSAETVQMIQRWEAFEESIKNGRGDDGEGKGDGGDDLPPPPPPTAAEMANNVIEKLREKKLRDGFASYLMENDHFRTWIHIAQEDSGVKAWFKSFLDDTVAIETSQIFDEACRLIMDQLFAFGKDALLNRKSKTADSYEMRVFHYLVSDEFVLICQKLLPTATMRASSAGWSILGHTLAEILRDWIIDAVRMERMKRDPEKFQRRLAVSLTDEELKSEANRILGWAVVSVWSKLKKKDTDERRLLDAMVCLEKDVDDAYFRTKYDLTTLLRNIGGEGGLALVAPDFFEWGKKLMRKVAKEMTVGDIEQRGDREFARAKKAILGDPELRSDFVLVCNRQEMLVSRGKIQDDTSRYNVDGDQQQKDNQPLPKSNDTTKTVEYALALKVYVAVVTKVCNARFGEVVKNYCDQKKLSGKGKLKFRSMLLAMENGHGGKTEEAATGKSNEANASNATTATANTAIATTTAAASPLAPSFAILVPGMNGAVGAGHLKGTVFVINGTFEEVHIHTPTAQEQLQKMIESFGGRVLQRLSKNITHLLCGKDAEGKKIDDALEKGAKIVNLRRLQKLLLGQLTFQSMNELDKLTKASFRGNAYEPAGAPPPPPPAPTTTTTTAAMDATTTATQSTATTTATQSTCDV